MKRLWFVLCAVLCLGGVAQAACGPLPTTPKTDRPGSALEAAHLRQEAYIRARLTEPGYATLALGDSIMGMWPAELLEEKWGGPLLKGGRGGSTTLHWLEWLDTWDWSRQDPAIVHLHIGRNDITTGACPRAVAASIMRVIIKVQAKWPNALVVWQNIPPGGIDLALKRPEIIEVNRLVRTQIAVRHFKVWDAWKVIWDRCQGARSCGLFLDGDKYRWGPVHFDPHAYALIARDAEVLP